MRTQSILVILFDGVQPLDVAGPVDVFALAARYAVEQLTFLGGRRAEPEPCDERTEDDSSVIMCACVCVSCAADGTARRGGECDRAERTVASLLSRGRCDGVDVGTLHT